MKIKSKIIFIVLLYVSFALAISFGTPADLPPTSGAVNVTAEYSKQFIYTANPTYASMFNSHRLSLTVGYTFLKWLELYGLVGGADADLSWGTQKNKSHTIDLNGTWELNPGVGIRIKPPVKFSAIGFKFHIMAQARYQFIRSKQEDYFVPSGMKMTGTVRLNEFEAGGMLVGYYRKFNMSFYAGVATRYEWSEINYTASLDKTFGSQRITYSISDQKLLLGTSISADETFFPHMVYPFFGINWHFAESYIFSIETNIADVSSMGDFAPKLGFSIGLANYR